MSAAEGAVKLPPEIAEYSRFTRRADKAFKCIYTAALLTAGAMLIVIGEWFAGTRLRIAFLCLIGIRILISFGWIWLSRTFKRRAFFPHPAINNRLLVSGWMISLILLLIYFL